MFRGVALPLVQNARARLVQVEAICKHGYSCDAAFAKSERTAILGLLLDSMEELRTLKLGFDRKAKITVAP